MKVILILYPQEKSWGVVHVATRSVVMHCCEEETFGKVRPPSVKKKKKLAVDVGPTISMEILESDDAMPSKAADVSMETAEPTSTGKSGRRV